MSISLSRNPNGISWLRRSREFASRHSEEGRMNWTRLRWKYWTDIFQRRQVDRDLSDEIRAHVDLEIQRRIEHGESAETSRMNALREIRSVGALQEVTCDVCAWNGIERTLQDVRYALRMMARRPMF